jgi:hypothetical protein
VRGDEKERRRGRRRRRRRRGRGVDEADEVEDVGTNLVS